MKIVLLCGIAIQLMALRTANSVESCARSLGTGLVNDGLQREQIVRSDPTPPYHLGNFEKAHKPTGYENFLGPYYQSIYALQIGRIVFLDDVFVAQKITAVSIPDNTIEVTSPLGTRRVFKIKTTRFGLDAVEITSDISTSKPSGTWPKIVDDSLISPGAVPLDFNLHLVRQLAEFQSEVSMSQTDPRSKGFLGLIDMNAAILEKLLEHEPLTLEDLKLWNQKIEVGPLAGVLRGEKTEKIDLIHAQLQAHNGSSGNPLWYYVPGEEVLERMMGLLKMVNHISNGSTYLEIAQIYQDFIVTHPFMNGNGRVARGLVIYCLARAGMPKFTLAKIKLPRDALFQTPEELAFHIRGN